MLSKIILLNKKPNQHFIYLFFLFLLFILILICLTHDYDTYKIIGLKNSNDANKVTITIPYDKVDILEERLYIMYDNEKHYIKDIAYKDVFTENNIPYINVELTLDFEVTKEVITFKLYYNHERIIKKIIKIVKEE